MSSNGPARRVVVTGAAQGIGLVIRHKLELHGYEVIGLDVRVTPDCVTLDITDSAAVQDAASRIGPVDGLVNNAGIWRPGSILDASPEDFSHVLAVNLLGAFHCVKSFGRAMAERRRGAIVNVSSLAAHQPVPGGAAYGPSKVAVEAFTRQLALELGPVGVRANAVAPGLIPTPGSQDRYGEDLAHRAASVPQGRLGRPEDVALVIRWLLSDEARYVNGVTIPVDGGFSAGLFSLLQRTAPSAGHCEATSDEGTFPQDHQ